LFKNVSKLIRGEGLSDAQFGVLLVLPALSILATIILYPLLNSVILGFFDASLLSGREGWVGIQQFVELLQSPRFHETLINTVIFVGGATLLSFVLGFALALVLNQNLRGRGFLRGSFILPWITPGVVASFLWMWIFHQHYGVVNSVLSQLGIIDGPIAWLSSSGWAMVSVIIAKSWKSFPWFMVLLLAGLQTIPDQEIEAARIDGAGKIQIFRYIIIPHIRFIIFVVTLLGAIWNFQHFQIIWIMTEGGPAHTTTTLAIEVYQTAFQAWDLGKAGAIGLIWMVILTIFILVYLRLSGGVEDVSA